MREPAPCRKANSSRAPVSRHETPARANDSSNPELAELGLELGLQLSFEPSPARFARLEKLRLLHPRQCLRSAWTGLAAAWDMEGVLDAPENPKLFCTSTKPGNRSANNLECRK